MSDNLDFYSTASVEQSLQKLNTTPAGLSAAEAKARLEQFGYNTISEKKELGVIVEFLSHFKNPLIIILLSAALISGYLGETKSLVVIVVMILASVILDFFEEHSANNAAKKLKEKVSVTTTVIRGGNKLETKASQICAGDIIFLSSGDLVPADARIIEADDLFVNQSALTGESYPQEKTPEVLVAATETDSRNTNIVFLGSSVVSGTATAVVFQTGQNTEFGKIAKSILEKGSNDEFELGITKFGFFITKVILAITLLVFLANAVLHHNFLESFIFAIAIAVGVTPELLPMVMSITMARSSQRMAKSGVIVKKLSSIPNFGSMDILCTDKTGTLTEDNIQLVNYTDIFGKHDETVFIYTYLNSTYQTGVKNPLDNAVLTYKKTDIAAYKKTEEIPFDFVRKMMSIAVLGPNGRVMITKGAPEAVISHCTHYYRGGKTYPLTEDMKQTAFDYYKKLSAEGYRVLALATKPNLAAKDKYTIADEADLTLTGLVSFLDPAKTDVRKVLLKLEKYGIEIKVITGDNELVTEKICRDVGLEVRGVMSGSELATLSNDALAVRAEATTIFARFSPDEKNRIIAVLRGRGHVVGYMGDGINDAPSLKTADVGISVNNAVDIAKETADIILTKKHLGVVIEGVIEGRRAFGNTMKYIMMGLSSNFGNMFSVLGAVVYLPFLPMLPIQILFNNFIYDISQITIPWDNVDADWLNKPKKWNLAFVKKFMYVFGPISSVFDLLTFYILFSVFQLGESAFQTGWFIESLATQTLVIHIIRTKRLPFIQSRASNLLIFSTVTAVIIGWLTPYTPLGDIFNFSPLPWYVMLTIAGLVIVYLGIVEIAKRILYRRDAI
ncbi:MAG: magnesium-translocating P-type ATPase [Patescibacteria group bacterium]